MEKVKEITVRKEKVSTLNSEYGLITYESWCRKEAARIKNGARYAEKGKLCWVERVLQE